MVNYFLIVEYVWKECEFNFLDPTKLMSLSIELTFELCPSINLTFAENVMIVSKH